MIGLTTLFRCSVRNEFEGIVYLVNGIQKWQSHQIKLMPLKLRKQVCGPRVSAVTPV